MKPDRPTVDVAGTWLKDMMIRKDVKTVEWAKLKPVSEHSVFRSECPSCEGGILPVQRDRVTLELLEHDRCLLCGRPVRYSDIETIRKVAHGEIKNPRVV